MNLNLKEEERLEAKYEKQMICLEHKKRCAECKGEDEYGNKCEYFKKEERRVIN